MSEKTRKPQNTKFPCGCKYRIGNFIYIDRAANIAMCKCEKKWHITSEYVTTFTPAK